jgi:hypothetical protein
MAWYLALERDREHKRDRVHSQIVRVNYGVAHCRKKPKVFCSAKQGNTAAK